jgi:hypothetical protein
LSAKPKQKTKKKHRESNHFVCLTVIRFYSNACHVFIFLGEKKCTPRPGYLTSGSKNRSFGTFLTAASAASSSANLASRASVSAQERRGKKGQEVDEKKKYEEVANEEEKK